MRLSCAELREIGLAAFRAAGAPEDTASCVTDALLLAELDGMPSHGYSRIPFYVAQARTGKVNALAKPLLTHPLPALTRVDAAYGFAFPAIKAGLAAAIPVAKRFGLAYVGVRNSHHCGMLGHYVEDIARQGCIGMAFSNSPAAMAPLGGNKASFGTNPIAFGCPVADGEPIIVDMSLSKVARGKIMNAKQKGETRIPEGWALDAQGQPTTDPDKALKGTMIPLGDAKGAALALMVEILAASLTGAHHAFEASSFFEAEGPAPAIGQSFFLVEPRAVNPEFPSSLGRLMAHITSQEGTRVPGARRFAQRAQRRQEGVDLPDVLYEKIRACSC